MNPIELMIVAFNEFLGAFVHQGSSMSSVAALNLGLF